MQYASPNGQNALEVAGAALAIASIYPVFGLARGISNKTKNVVRRVEAPTGNRVTNSAYDLAKSGGKHSGFLKNNLPRTTEEPQKGVTKLQKQIDTHEALIKDPANMMRRLNKGDWDALDPRQQKALIEKKWPSDIQRQRQQQNILQGILDDRG